MSTPKSVLLHLDATARSVDRVRVARQLAEAFDAEVSAVYAVPPSLMRYPTMVEGSAAAVEMIAQIDEENRAAAQARFVAAGAGEPRLSWVEAGSDAFWDFGRRALYHDLVLLGQHDAADPQAGALGADFLPDLLIETGKPALVIPRTGAAAPVGGCVLVAWKESREAARAVSAALPWLHRAAEVHLVCYADPAEPPLRALQARLSAHGITARAHRGGPDHAGAGEQLLSLAADVGADLLVMGCYGRSRVREWALGGATRTILQSMTLPVLMTH